MSLFLASTSSKIQLITADAVTVDVYAAYTDFVSPSTVTPGAKHTAISTAATTDIVLAPAASTYRTIKSLHIVNKHASLSVLVTLQVTDGTTVIELEKLTLLAGERFSHIADQGFQLFDANAIPKTGTAPAQVYTRTLAADLANTTTTAAKVTGLDLACGVGIWLFEYYALYTTVITTTGIKFGCNHTGTVTSFVYWRRELTALATAADGNADQDIKTTAGGVMMGWADRVKSTSAPLISAGVDTNGADQLAVIEGLAIVTAAGNMELYSASEVGTSSTSVKAGSVLRLTKAG